MAAITSLGVGSGLDLGTLVSGLIEAERAPTENRLNLKQQNFTAELSAFGLLRSSLAQFQTSLGGLKTSTAFNAKAISASDSSVFSTSVESIADVGSYSVEVTALARAQSLATSAATAFATVDDVIGSGTTMSQVLSLLREAGANPILVVVVINKTSRDSIEGVPLRALVRARTVV